MGKVGKEFFSPHKEPERSQVRGYVRVLCGEE